MRPDPHNQRIGDDQQVGIEIAWCPGCRADVTVETVTLPDDPAPVAVCVDCGGGIELWWATPGPASVRERRRPRAS
ncbi:MAG: hypothetical protein GEV09_14180 [Pseudonocardiaceae bacterium]|nr:hypothetical protein [Pseudonocardiaceae bacterium]